MCHVGDNTVLLEHLWSLLDLELDQQLSVGNFIILEVLQDVVGLYDMALIALSIITENLLFITIVASMGSI